MEKFLTDGTSYSWLGIEFRSSSDIMPLEHQDLCRYCNFSLTHSAREDFEKLAFKKTKNATLNSFIANARANSESKLTFSESSFNFLQIIVVFCTLYPRGYTTGGCAPYKSQYHCQQLARLKQLMMSQ